MNARSPFVIGGVVVGVLVALGLFLLSRTGSGEPPAAAPPPAPMPTPTPTEGTPTTAPSPDAVLADESTTVLRVRVADCNGCQVTAVADDTDSGESQWSATVSGGVAQVEVQTPRTLGMAFFLQGEKDGNDTPARTLVTLMPDGAEAGQPVGANRIEGAKRAQYCWAGTTLDIAVLNFTAQAGNGRVRRAWANPALPALTPVVSLGAKPESTAKIDCSSATP